MNKINHLIVSSTIDYSTDLICCELEKSNKRYLRINRDSFLEYKICYDLEFGTLSVNIEGVDYSITNDSLESVFFRAPVFIRAGKAYSLQEQLYKSQWSAFIRNLIVFNKAKWINHPVNTYRAENKLFQLQCAHDLCFDVPKTFVGNTLPKDISLDSTYIVKSLDTALFYEEQQEMFTYSTMLTGSELYECSIKDAPIIVQECLLEKIDIRITVIGDKLFPVSITKNGEHIIGDWRKTEKHDLSYKTITIPHELEEKIYNLMDLLGLSFGGLDFAFSEGKYYFIEVNPTGEWGWISNACDLRLEYEITKQLLLRRKNERIFGQNI